ncbi:MAG TPA: glycosyltransferase family 2 protein, partial [Armatimonadota bacterium]|nr:glycosyltransferase family 2 protein [Armatimonadota bacterium]
RSLLRGGYPAARWEIILADGMSTDGTREIIARVAADAAVPIYIADNPRGTIPHALNLAIAGARGEIIIRADAHARYPREYVARCVRTLRRQGADNVGGPVTTAPGADTVMARAIALALSHPFGVGNSAFRTTHTARETDTVPFGCFPASVFRRIGLFDERLRRNEDYEFNRRLRRAGGHIWLDPALASTYYSRDTLGGLLRQAWENGMWNALSHALHPAIRTPRHVLPLFFTLGALALAVTAAPLPWMPPLALPLRLGYGAYALLALLVSARLARRRGWRLFPALLALFPLFHFTYGAGIAWGWLRVLARRYPWRPEDGIPACAPRPDTAAVTEPSRW